MLDITFGGALIAGLLSFLTPCVLPMVPFYLSYMAGLSIEQLRGNGEIRVGAQRRLVLSSIFFALGVTTIFVLLGLGASAVGRTVRDYQEQLSYVAAAVLTVFGLHFLGVIRVPILFREAKVETQAVPTNSAGAYVMGLAFGFGWTPCVGPALAAILMVASGLGSVWRGGALLAVYGLGMTLPFIAAAFFAKPFLHYLQKHRSYLKYAEQAMGVMLLVFALLIATSTINYISAAMLRWAPWFLSIG